MSKNLIGATRFEIFFGTGNIKSLVGYFLTGAGALFGILGVLMQLGGILPPEYNKPIVGNIIMLVGVIAAALGYQDDIEEGRKGLIQLIFDFFNKSTYRKYGIVALVAAVRAIREGGGELPNGLELGFTLFLLLVQIFALVPAYVAHRIARYAQRGF